MKSRKKVLILSLGLCVLSIGIYSKAGFKSMYSRNLGTSVIVASENPRADAVINKYTL